jgi:hypothetical protein
MKNKYLLPALTLLSLVGVGVGYFLGQGYEYGLCGKSIFCLKLMNHGDALFYGALGLGIVFAALMAVPSAVRAWKKFAIWAIPLLVIIFATTQDSMGEWISLSPSVEQTFQFLSTIYVIISIVIIGTVKLKKGK